MDPTDQSILSLFSFTYARFPVVHTSIPCRVGRLNMEKSAHSAVDLMQQFFSIGSEEYDEPGIFHVLFGYPNASLAIDIQQVTSDFSLAYKVIATVVHVTIFVCGTVGNILLIAVALCTKSLQTPTYRYLVSFKYATMIRASGSSVNSAPKIFMEILMQSL